MTQLKVNLSFSALACHHKLGKLLLPLVFLSGGAYAQVPTSEGEATPAMMARRVEEAPAIDGRLDDAVWQVAPPVTEFYQKEPVEGEAATEETRVRILYDETFLYVGVKLLDSRPAEIRATELRRDSTLHLPTIMELRVILNVGRCSVQSHLGWFVSGRPYSIL